MSPSHRVPQFVACAAAVFLGVPHAAAQTYPSKPVRIVVPYGPGGISDRLARLVGQRLTTQWGQQIIVENRPGGGTNIGTELVTKAPADGYTLLASGIANTVMPALHAKLPYDPIADLDTSSQSCSAER